MNGIHDMGGMHGMGAIRYEKNEPPYHAPWEARVHAMSSAVGATGKLRLGLRPPIESIPAAEYLRMSYYERWLTALIERLVASDLVTRAEIEDGRPEKQSANPPLAVSPAVALAALFRVPGVRRNQAIAARFQTGQTVRTLNINPVTHTRLPRYARGKTGTIERDHGVFAFMETTALSLGDKPQHLYSVRFSARELWGKQAPLQDAVYLDLYDDYLEPV
jgi:nitrile hydratase subunit beta